MSDTMGIISFEKLLEVCLKDYDTKAKILEVEEKYFYRPKNRNLGMRFNNEYISTPIGPAAGPHTQLAQNILAAYLTGSRFFELKTVQVIDGEQMRKMVAKPCIEARNAGYNVEWSTELTVWDATEEYIKASVLLQVFAIELGLADAKDFMFNISVGYDLEGIQSKKISDFIDQLKEAKNTGIFEECMSALKKNINQFRKFKLEDIDKISSRIANMITISTMHGCKPSEILDIGRYLITAKKTNIFIKLNPTLLGYDQVRQILDDLGYEDILLREEDFENDLKYDDATEILSQLTDLGKANGTAVGINLTNTLPVCNSRGILPGESMYLSGKPLYPIALGVAEKFAQSFHGNIHISLSGGIDKNNITGVLKTGIAPVTFSTILLKPRGFINTKNILSEIENEDLAFEKLDVQALKKLSLKARTDPNYKNKGENKILSDTLPTYDCFKVNCGICVDVCPNRANMKLYDDSFDAAYQIVHIENRCYECGNCHTFCTRGGFPYFKKITLFPDQEQFEHSRNAGIVRIGENQFRLRDETGKEYVYRYHPDHCREGKKELERMLITLMRDAPYLLVNDNT